MRGTKAKALRRQAPAVTVGRSEVVYDDKMTKAGRVFGVTIEQPRLLSRVLKPGCTRAVYQSLK